MSGPTAVFHGVEVPETLLAMEIQNHQAATLSEARAQAGRALAVKAVLLDRARELGLEADPERNFDGQEETCDEALIRAVLSEEIDVDAPSEADLLAVYDAQPEAFMSPPLIEAAHILVAVSGEDAIDPAAARAKATDLIFQLRARPEIFGRLAMEHSACPSASEGGSLGQLRPGDILPKIWNALMEMKAGEISSEPVLTEHGWHVLRLDQLSPAARLPFEYVRPHIAMKIEARFWTRAAARYVDVLLVNSAAEPRLKLDTDGRLSDEENSILRLDGLLGSALADIESIYDQLPPRIRQSVELTADREGGAPGGVLARSIRKFLASANDEAWTQLISRLRDSSSPLVDSLDVVVAHQLPPVRTSHRLIEMRSRVETKP